MPGGMAGLAPARAPAATSSFGTSSPFSGVPDLQSGIRGLLSNSGGAFTPNYLRDLMRKSAFQRSKNMRRRGDVLSRLAGLDPMQQRQAMIDLDREASSGLSGALNEADIQGGQGWQQFMMGLLRSERGDEQQRARDREQREWEESQGGGIGGFLGGALGTGLGAFTGGAGAGLAKRLF